MGFPSKYECCHLLLTIAIITVHLILSQWASVLWIVGHTEMFFYILLAPISCKNVLSTGT